MNRRAFLAGAAGAAAVCGCSRLRDGDSESDTPASCDVDADSNPGTPAWPTATGDVRNTRSVPRGDAPEPPLSVEWTLPLDGYTGVPSPTVSDGTAFTSNMDSTVHAVDAASGDGKWTADVADPGIPVVADETVVVGGDDGSLAAFERDDGSTRWTATVPVTDSFLFSQPTVAAGTVLVPTGLGLAAFGLSSGEERWTYETGLAVGRHPAVVDGAVYATGEDAYLHVLDLASGDRSWWAKTPAPVETEPVVVDGAVYVGTDDGTVLAFEADGGDERWRTDLSGWVERLAVDGGHVYVGTGTGLRALRADTGEQCWRFNEFDASYAGGLAASPRRIYATVSGGRSRTSDALAALDPASGEVEWRFSSGDHRLTSGPAVVDGAVYVGGMVAGTGLATVKLS